MACDPQQLVTDAACIQCGIPDGMKPAVLIALLCRLSEGGGGGATAWGGITGTLSNQLDLQAALNALTAAIIANRPASGTGSPTGVVTPAYVGQYYTDLDGPGIYVANGMTVNDWISF